MTRDESIQAAVYAVEAMDHFATEVLNVLIEALAHAFDVGINPVEAFMARAPRLRAGTPEQTKTILEATSSPTMVKNP
jgi:hypothetical protein